MSRRLPTFLHGAEPEALLAAAETPRDRLILEAGLYLGLRVSELVNLTVDRIDLMQRRAFIYKGKGDKDRYVPIPQRLIEPLRAWIGNRTTGPLFPSPRAIRSSSTPSAPCSPPPGVRGPGFGFRTPGPENRNPLSARAIQKLLKRLAQKANLTGAAEPRRVTPHKLRHAYATRLLETGADLFTIKELLGHSNLATTQIYLHATDRRKQEACDRL